MNNDLISREAAFEILVKYCPDDDGTCSKADADPREMLDEIENLPDVDAVEVVRCKDCEYFEWGDYCTQDKMEHSKCREDDFCSYGRRKNANDMKTEEVY